MLYLMIDKNLFCIKINKIIGVWKKIELFFFPSEIDRFQFQIYRNIHHIFSDGNYEIKKPGVQVSNTPTFKNSTE
jgi:hypothetical protein